MTSEKCLQQRYLAEFDRKWLSPTPTFLSACVGTGSPVQSGLCFRELKTNIGLAGVKSQTELNCSSLLIESIPSGVYVDLHELKSREKQGGPQVSN